MLFVQVGRNGIPTYTADDMTQFPEFYRRHLPHWQPSGATFFVTFRLKDSLPDGIIESLRLEQERERSSLANLTPGEKARQAELLAQRSFHRWDSWLDKAGFGPVWLARPEVARIVYDALRYRDGRIFGLYAFCIMSNHVHAVFGPLESRSDCQSDLPLYKIMQSLKRYTARQANLVLGREGPFWQDESYDHVIRNNDEFLRIIYYVLKNPVRAGLVECWEDWPWTYCKPDLL